MRSIVLIMTIMALCIGGSLGYSDTLVPFMEEDPLDFETLKEVHPFYLKAYILSQEPIPQHLIHSNNAKWTPKMNGDFDVTYADVSLNISPPSRLISSTIKLTIKSNKPSLTHPSFYYEIPKITSVTDEAGNDLSFTINNQYGTLDVVLHQPLVKDKEITLVFVGEETIQCDTGGGGMAPCEITSRLTYFAGMSLIPMDYSSSEKFKGTFRIQIPEDLTVAATGWLIDTIAHDDGTKTVVFEHSEETSYVGLAIAEFDETTKQAGDLDLTTFTLDNGTKNAEGILQTVQSAVELYSDSFYPYPFGKLDVVTIGDAFGGGFGPLSTIFVMESAFTEFDHPDYNDTFIQLFSHEVAHQWWAHVVDHAAYANWVLSESFAEFSSSFHFETIHDNSKGFIENAQSFMVGVPAEYDTPLYPYDYYTAYYYHFYILYSKGSVVIDQLRYVLGEDVFLEGIQQFLEDNAFEFATIPDLQDTMEAVSGQDLESFFSQWFERSGYAKLNLSTVVEDNESGETITLNVEQAGLSWELPVNITIYTSDGTEDHTLQIESTSTQSFEFQLKGELSRIQVHETPIRLKTCRSKLQGDVDLSGFVDGADLVELASGYERTISMTYHGYDYPMPDAKFKWILDINADNSIDEMDLILLQNNIGKTNDT